MRLSSIVSPGNLELLLARIYARQDLQARGGRGGFRGIYGHGILDRRADAVSVQAPSVFLATT
jgi:hypothetical protein